MNFTTFLATLLGVGLLSTAVFAQDMTAINKLNLEETSTVAEFDLETTMAVVSSTTKAPAVQKQKVVISKPSPFLQSTKASKKLNLAESAPRSITGSSTVSPNMSDVSVAKKPTFRQNKAAPLLKKVHDWMIVVLLVCVMFAMGCSITWAQVWSHVRRPVGVLIGMLSQFVLLPFSAYCLIVIFKLDPLHATGLLILACSPGGVTSNIFAYFLEGDLSLSVTMTSFSTVVALFMMPFNVWLYGRNLETDALVIPYGKMTVSLLSLTTPVAIGMLVNWKLPKVAPILTQIGSVAGFAIIVVCQTLEVFIFPDIFNDVPAALYMAEFLLPLLGLALGFIAASIFRLEYPIRRTIAIEAGIQNVGTALTIITLSFPFEQLRKVWLFPFLYAFSMLAVCCVIAVIYRLQKRLGRKKSIDIASEFDAAYPKLQKIQQKAQQKEAQAKMNSVVVSPQH
ncbi:hypothetical protein TYRP_017622, partial [Tyrophagus putrescentiae]